MDFIFRRCWRPANFKSTDISKIMSKKILVTTLKTIPHCVTQTPLLKMFKALSVKIRPSLSFLSRLLFELLAFRDSRESSSGARSKGRH